jgi:hypothetical protein
VVRGGVSACATTTALRPWALAWYSAPSTRLNHALTPSFASSSATPNDGKHHLGQSNAQALCQQRGRFQIRHGHECQKLLAAHASQHVAVAQLGAHHVHHSFQCTVACGMAEAVVNSFEMVQVQHDQAYGLPIALVQRGQTLHLLEHIASAVGTGELVVRHQVIELRNGGIQLSVLGLHIVVHLLQLYARLGHQFGQGLVAHMGINVL